MLSQRYFINEAFFNNVTKSGPIFLLIGGESAIDDGFINAGMWIEWAQKHSALCFQVEHRFYGISYPTPYIFINMIISPITKFVFLKETYRNIGMLACTIYDT